MKQKSMKPKELITRLNQGEKIFALDVRSAEKIKEFQLKHGNLSMINIEKGAFLNEMIDEAILEGLPKNREIVVICATGNSASAVANALEEKSYNVIVLKGGVQEYLDPSSE